MLSHASSDILSDKIGIFPNKQPYFIGRIWLNWNRDDISTEQFGFCSVDGDKKVFRVQYNASGYTFNYVGSNISNSYKIELNPNLICLWKCGNNFWSVISEHKVKLA